VPLVEGVGPASARRFFFEANFDSLSVSTGASGNTARTFFTTKSG
jgi:hypothetical protein